MLSEKDKEFRVVRTYVVWGVEMRNSKIWGRVSGRLAYNTQVPRPNSVISLTREW